MSYKTRSPIIVKKTVFLVDGHPVVREGLIRLMNGENDLIVCGEASEFAQALTAIKTLSPSLVISELHLKGVNGLDVVKSFRNEFPGPRLLIFSSQNEFHQAERAMQAGANGYIMKQESGPTVLSAIRQVLDGKMYVSPELYERILQKFSHRGEGPPPSILDQLSEREREVFELIGQGYGTRQIAEKLAMSIKTVETHRQHIKGKLKMESTFELVQRAIRWVHHENAFPGGETAGLMSQI